jgi:hemerythrin
MALMDWSSALDIGVEAMNAEHRKLLDIMNRLFDQAKAGAGKATLGATIRELGAYTVEHFSDEERYMQKIAFPDFERHRLIHQDLLRKFSAFQQEFDAGPGVVSDGFFSFLRLWLSAHIQGIDKKYGDHSKKKAA